MAAAIRIWQVFPFDLSPGWSTAVRVLLVIAIAGSCIALVVQIVSLAALDRLRLIGDVTRYQADAIRFAAEVGIPKQRIHQLTGRSRSAINQTLAREAQRPRSTCDYCLHEHFQAARRGEEVPPLRDASGYLIYRIGDRPEIVAQRLCLEHLKQDWANRLPVGADNPVTTADLVSCAG